MKEQGQSHGLFTVRKYKNNADYAAGKAYEESTFPNVMLNEGIQELEDYAFGLSTAAVAYGSTTAHLGVGISTASSGVATSTDLLGSTASQAFVLCSTTHPSRASQAVTWQSVFATGVAEFAWREFTVRNSLTTTGRTRNLNRAVSNQGTKGVGQTWTLDLTLTIS